MEDGSVGTQLRCSRCGHAAPPGDNFCTECGAPVFPEAPRRPLFADEIEYATHQPDPQPPTPTPAPTPAPVRRRRHRGAWLLALLLVVAAAGVGYLLGHHGDSPTQAHATGLTPLTPSAPSVGSSQTPTGSGTPSGQAASPPAGQPSMPPQEQLQQVARQDDTAVRELVGTWNPQLAALAAGVGGDASWSQALLHYRKLKDTYPTALLLDTGKWPHSYELGGMYAVVVPLPGPTSSRALRWCQAHVGSPQDCAAKLIDTTGTWDNNFDSGKPGPG